MIKNILAFIGGAFLIHKGYEMYYEQQKEEELKAAGQAYFNRSKPTHPDDNTEEN